MAAVTAQFRLEQHGTTDTKCERNPYFIPDCLLQCETILVKNKCSCEIAAS